MILDSRVGACLLITTVLSAGGCATLNADRELRSAEANVEARLGVRPDFPSAPSMNEPSDGSWSLSDRDAVVWALAHDAELLEMVERVRESRADLVQEGLLPNPVLSVDLAWPVAGGGGTKVAVGLTQQLVTLLTRDDRMRAADDELTAAVLELSDRAMAVAARARSAHARLVHARARVTPARLALELAQSSLEAARGQRAAGLSTIVDVNRRLAVLLSAQTALEEREADVRGRERDLLAIIGTPQYFGSVETTESVMGASESVGDEGELVAIALEQRLDVAAFDARAKAALALAKVEPSQAFADLAAGPSFEHTDDGRQELGPSLSVPIPIFDTGDARRAKGVAIARQAELHAIAARRTAISEVRSAWAAAQLARARLARAEGVSRGLADEGVMLAERAVQSGETDRLSLLDAKSVAASVQLMVIDAREQAELAAIELWRAVGGMLSPRTAPVSE